MTSRPRTDRSEGGYTLVELLIYTTLLAMVMTSVYSLLITNTKTHASQENIMEMTQDLRAAVGMMVRDIRMAGCDSAGSGGVGFIGDAQDDHNTDGNSIHFSMDANDDGDTFDDNENINYYLDASNIIRRYNDTTGNETADPGQAVSPLAESITALSFTYVFSDGDVGLPGAVGDGTDDLDDIRSVRISITSQTPKKDPLTRMKKTRTLTTRIRVRNAGL